jgi:cytosine/uracil/thiamine/allantoin permease
MRKLIDHLKKVESCSIAIYYKMKKGRGLGGFELMSWLINQARWSQFLGAEITGIISDLEWVSAIVTVIKLTLSNMATNYLSSAGNQGVHIARE